MTAPGGPQPERSRPTILVVEDEKDILDLIAFNLERDRYSVVTARTGEEALELLSRQPVQLVILDVLLPGIDGLEVCRRLRADSRNAGIPILMLTAKTEDADIVAGLELGAEDYVTKPFSPRVLLARVRSILRRRTRAESDSATLRCGELEIDPGRHLVRLRGEPVLLTLTEFKMLQLLAGRPGWVFTRNQLLDGVQGTESFVLDRTVDVHIGSLRKKLGEYGSRIETVRGLGYRLSEVGS